MHCSKQFSFERAPDVTRNAQRHRSLSFVIVDGRIKTTCAWTRLSTVERARQRHAPSRSRNYLSAELAEDVQKHDDDPAFQTGFRAYAQGDHANACLRSIHSVSVLYTCMHACMYKHACKRPSLSLNPCASHRKQLTQHARTRAELQHSNDVLTPGSLDLHEEKRRHQHRRRPSVPSCRENSCDGGGGGGTEQVSDRESLQDR